MKVPSGLIVTEPLAALVASATAVGSEPKSSGPFPLSANRFPETEASSFTENTSSTASGVEVIVMLAVAVLD